MNLLTEPGRTKVKKSEMLHPHNVSLCALVPYPLNTVPGQRFRIEQWQPYLEKEGILVDFFPFADARLMQWLYQPGHWVKKAAGLMAAFARRIRQLPAARRYDVILIHRAICLFGPAALERVASVLNRPIIFDFDDAIFLLHTTEVNRWFGWLKFPGKTDAICRLSDHIVVGNTFLADYARRHNPSVTVIPSSVDTERFRPVDRASTSHHVVIGWTGSSTSQTYLEQFAPVLRQLVVRRQVEIRVHSDRPPVLDGVPVSWRPWSPDTEAEEIAQFDIGIMPMPDELWAYGKCAMKALLYMACGVPTIAQAIGANCEVIQHGENGFLASTPEAWLAYLEALIDNPALRKKLGASGRRTVEQRYSMQQCATLFARVVREAVSRH